MEEEIQKKVEDTFDNVIKEIDSKYMRKNHMEMHRCALNCYERPNGSPRSDAECSKQCYRISSRATAIFNHCLEEYNRTLTTCMESCVDSVRYSKDLSPENERKILACMKTCVNDFVSKQNSVVEKTVEMLNGSK